MGSGEPGDKLCMRRPAELIHNLHMIQMPTPCDQHRRIAGKTHRITGDIGNFRHFCLNKFSDLCFGPGTGRIKDNSIRAGQLVRQQRAAEKITRFCRYNLQTFSMPPACIQRRHHRTVTFYRMHSRRFSKWQRKCSATGEEIDNRGRSRRDLKNTCRQRGLTMGCRLKKCARRWGHSSPPDHMTGRCAHGDHLVAPRQAGQCMIFADRSELLTQWAIKRFAIRNRDIQTIFHLCDHHRKRSFPAGAHKGKGLGNMSSLKYRGLEQYTVRDRNDGVGGTSVKPDHRALFRTPRSKARPPSRARWRCLDGSENSLYSVGMQRIAHQICFPGGHEIIIGVLQLAPAAGPEMPTGG